MQVDGREVTVSGSLLQPPTRRTNDILRLVLSAALLAIVITSSVITRTRWDELEKSISRIIGVLSPTQSDVVYLVYGVAILALPFMILFGLIISRQWKLLVPYAAAALIAFLALSITGRRLSAPQWHFDLSDRLRTVLSQFLDDPRWIGMLAAVLTVSGPWLPARWRHWWWTLLLAFIPIHLVVSAIVPARSLLGLAVGWFVGALVILVSGTPALEVPLDGAVRALGRRGFVVCGLTVVRPAGAGPLMLSADIHGFRCHRGDRDVRPASKQRRRAASAVGQAAAAPHRGRTLSGVHAPRRRASRADGHGRRRPGCRQHVDDRRRRARPGLDVVRAQARSRSPAEAVRHVDPGDPGVGIAAKAARRSDLARRPARRGDDGRRRHRLVRWVRQRRIRRHRQPTRCRHCRTAGDDVIALRRRIRGQRGDRRVGQGHRADRVPQADEIRCAETYPGLS